MPNQKYIQIENKREKAHENRLDLIRFGEMKPNLQFDIF